MLVPMATFVGQAPQTTLRGRAAEQAALNHLLESVRAGSSGALVVLGEAGIGKTVLLDYLAREAEEAAVREPQHAPAERLVALHHLDELARRGTLAVDDGEDPRQ